MNFKKIIKNILTKMGICKANKPFDYNTLYAGRYIKTGQAGSDVILNELKKNKPCLIARFGSVELSALNGFMKSNGRKIKYKDNVKNLMDKNAGFFPSTDEALTGFCQKFIPVLQNVDVMGVWMQKGEEKALKTYSPSSKFVELDCICPIRYDSPWTKYLEGKKVLVIHPFEDSIKSQYVKRELLFKNQDFLPEFELKTLKAVQSIANSKADLPYKDWFEALDDMKSQIAKIDFDVAIVGAGAYGIFLAEYCKQLNKQAIHMGGSTQLLFGIIGKRWECESESPGFKEQFFNEYWTYPLAIEKPKGHELVENSCYW